MPSLAAAATPQFNFPSEDSEMDAMRFTMDPSAQYANVLWGKGTFNTQILVGDGEGTESVVRRFKKVCVGRINRKECCQAFREYWLLCNERGGASVIDIVDSCVLTQ